MPGIIWVCCSRTKAGFEEAERAFSQALEIQIVLLGETHPRVISTTRNLGVILGLLERYDEGIARLEHALFIKKQREGIENLRTLGYMQAQYALLLQDGGYSILALAEAKEAVMLLEETPQVAPTHLSDGLAHASIIYLENGVMDLAEEYAKRSLDIRNELYDADHPKVAQAQCIYGRVLAMKGDLEEARALLQQGLPVYESWSMANKDRVDEARKVLEELD